MLLLLLHILLCGAPTGGSTNVTIAEGEKFLKYEWKVVTASSYIYGKDADSLTQSNLTAIKALIAAEVAEGIGRFLDQIMNGCWLLSEQKSWARAETIRNAKCGQGVLPRYSESFVDTQTMECVSILEDALKRFGSIWDREDPSICWSIRNAIERQLSSSRLPEAGSQRD